MARAQFRYIAHDLHGRVVQKVRVYPREVGTSTPAAGMWDAEVGGNAITSIETNDQGEAVAWFDTPRRVDVLVTSNGGTAHYPGSPNAPLASWADFTESKIDVFPDPADLATVRAQIETTEIWSRTGNAVVTPGYHRWYADKAYTIRKIRASVNTAPVGASLIVDVNKNGTTIFTTQANRPTIAAGTNTDEANNPDITALVAGDYVTVDIDQIGSTTPGSDLTVQVVLGLAA